MLAFLFGKKRKSSQKSKKLPKKVVRLARKYKVKVTLKRGSKKVYKPLRVIMKQIKMKQKASKKAGRVHRRKMHFGLRGGAFDSTDSSHGYAEDSKQNPGISSYTNTVIQDSRDNNARPRRVRAGNEYIDTQIKPFKPVYGVGKTFFNQTVPGNYPPNWQRLYQKDGSFVPLGYPFVEYKNQSFGKKRRSRKASRNGVPNKISGVLTGAKGRSITFTNTSDEKMTRKLKKLSKKNTYTFKVNGLPGGRIFIVKGPLKKGMKVKAVLVRKLK